MNLNTHRVHYEELTLAGVFHHTPNHFKVALSLIAEGQIDTSHLISGEKRLAEIGQVFRRGVQENPLKITIIP